MTASPFNRIIFPAILTSSTVFASLTLPLTALESSKLISSLPTPVVEWASSFLHPEANKLPIRYIGFSILASVGTGVGVAELMRMKQNHHQRQQDLIQLLEDSDAADSNSGADWRSGEAIQFSGNSADFFNASKQVNWLSGLDNLDIPKWSSLDDAAQEEPLEASASLSARFSLSQLAQVQEKSSSKIPTYPVETLEVNTQTSLDSRRTQKLDLSTLDEVSQHTCRIKVRGSQERLLALQLADKYYSFFRVRASLEQALTVVSTAEKRGETALVTPHARGYAVWIYQPEARLDSTDWEHWRLSA